MDLRLAFFPALAMFGLPAVGGVQEKAVMKGHAAGVTALAITPAGDLLASASHDQTVRLWDIVNWRQTGTFRGHLGEIHCLAFSGDGKRLASGAADATIRLWQIPGGESSALHGHSAAVLALAVSPDSRSLVSSAADGVIQLWNLKSGSPGGLFRSPGVERASSLAFSPDGKLLAWPDGNLIRIAEVQSRRTHATLAGHAGRVSSVLFSPGGRDLISAAFDNTVRVWDPATGAERAILFQGQSPIRAAACRGDGKLVAAAELTGEVSLLEFPSGALQASVTAPPGLSALVFSRSGRTLFSGHADGTIHAFPVQVTAPAVKVGPAARPGVATRKWTSIDGPFQSHLAVQDDQAATALRRLGATVRTDGDKVLWVDFGGKRLRDDSLEHLQKLPYVEWLDLSASGVSDAALPHLKGLVRLKKLDLSGTKVTDAGMAALKSLEALESLNVSDTLVTEAGLEQLRKLPRLKNLVCSAARWKIEAGHQRGRLMIDTDRVRLVFDDMPMSRHTSLGQFQVAGPGKSSATWRTAGVTIEASYADGAARLEIQGLGRRHSVELEQKGTRLRVDGGRSFVLEGQKKSFSVRPSGVHLERD